ncbi:MAG: ABC transporter permease, partial [Chloroflexi bacterium]|nr:ABC transporter permease [Chloroflexota bacterium]
MLHRLYSLITKELIQFTRDPILFAFATLAPMLQIVLLGQAIGSDITNIPVAIVDYDNSTLSRDIVTGLDNTSELVVRHYPDGLDEARALLDRGEVKGVVVIPRGFMAANQSPTSVPEMQVFIDGSSSFLAGRVLTAASGAVSSVANDVLVSSETVGGIRVFSEALYNRSLDFQPDAVSSQIALLTFQIVALVAVMGIVRERDIGTVEMLSITPISRLELIAGKAITPLLIGMLNFLLTFLISQFVFQIPQRGSLLLLFGLAFIYVLCETSYALMLSTITRSQQQAVTIVFVWAMLGLALSGYLVPITTLPQALQWVSWAIPLRHFLDAMRGVMLRGADLTAIIPQVGMILVLLVAMTFISTRTLTRVIE